MFGIWLTVVAVQAATHRFWRDEVRALSDALQGSGVIGMLRLLHGEGHPALWYLLLRGAHTILGRPVVLPIVSLLVAAAAMLTLVLRAPFSQGVIAAILFSQFAIYEYSVSARNYGISMLLMFLFASFYSNHRKKGVLLGILLFLLANTNVHSALLVAAMLVFWSGDLLFNTGSNRRSLSRIFFLNAALAVLGVVIAFLTVFPTFNDAAVTDWNALKLPDLLYAAFVPPPAFARSVVPWNIPALLFPVFDGTPWMIVRSLILFGCTLGLLRCRAAFMAGLLSLPAFSLFFTAIYPGFYRHHMLLVVLIITLYWLAAERSDRNEQRAQTPISRVGTVLFVFVLFQQVPAGIVAAATQIRAAGDRSHTAAEFMTGHPELRESAVIADPDYLLETLPYYISNPTYLMREHRYGKIVHFTRKALLRLDAGDVLRNARQLRQATNRPVVILLAREMKPLDTPQAYREGYDWEFAITPEQSREFLASTKCIAHHVAPPGSDEAWYAYVLY